MTHAYYAENLASLTNTPAHAESLLHSRERAARGIGLYVNANPTEFIEMYCRLNEYIVFMTQSKV